MAQRVHEFDTWREGYAGATVNVYVAGTTTLASLFTDEALSVAADNPQVLSTQTVNGRTFGKFTAPVYTASAYTLDINSTDQTGIERPPLTSLSGEDASAATVQAASGSEDIALSAVLDRVIYATDYGALGAVAATNNTTLTAAIGAAAANGGGKVILPDGTYEFTSLTLSAGVVLRGQGRDVTTIQCETLDNCITLSGDSAGLEALTLDGVDLGAGSVGVFSKANDETVFNDVEIKRFNTGMHFKGGRRANWRELYLSNCATGAKLHGDNDAGGGADGDDFRNNAWIGGFVQTCSSVGVELSYEDKLCLGNRLQIGFKDNTGTALNINGARYTNMTGSWAVGNTTTLAIDDDDDTDATDFNTVIGFHWADGTIEDGAATFTGTCQDVIISRTEIKDLDVTLTAPSNPVLVRDCTEDTDVTLSGDGEFWHRFRSINRGEATGQTTDASATAIWKHTLNPGETVTATAVVLGRQKNGEDNVWTYVSVGASRDGSELAYQNQTANFTLGDTLTGGTSGATAVIAADSDSGATGTLTLINIVGAFEDGETITDGSGGSAEANGTLSGQSCTLNGGGVNAIDVQVADGGASATFAANGNALELQVTGEASHTIDWVASVELVSLG